MENYNNIYSIIDDIESLMEDMLISGFNLVNTGMLDSMKQVSDNCEIIGLSFAGQALKDIMQAQERKRHNMNYNCEEIMSKYFLLNDYIKAVKSKLDIEELKEHMKTNKGEEA